MRDLISRLRVMIGDVYEISRPILGSQPQANFVWTDGELQDALDVHREDVRYALLEPRGTPQPYTGVMEYLDYYAPCGWWDSDTQLYGPAWQPLSPATSDFLTGHWTFSASQVPSVFVTGRRYDINGAAADMCEKWASLVKLDYSFRSETGAQFNRAEMSANLLTLAERFRVKQEPSIVEQVRMDTIIAGWARL